MFFFFVAGFPKKNKNLNNFGSSGVNFKSTWMTPTGATKNRKMEHAYFPLHWLFFKTGSLCHGYGLWHNPHIYNWVGISSPIIHRFFFHCSHGKKESNYTPSRWVKLCWWPGISKRTIDFAEKNTYSSWKVDGTVPTYWFIFGPFTSLPFGIGKPSILTLRYSIGLVWGSIQYDIWPRQKTELNKKNMFVFAFP